MSRELREHIAQTRLREEAFQIVPGESVLLSATLGFLTRLWWMFGAVPLFLLVGLTCVAQASSL